MGFHYKYNASGASRWMKCPGAKAIEKTVPERPAGKAALEGTAAHFLAEWALTHGYGLQVNNQLVGNRVWINHEGDAFKVVGGPGCPPAPYAGIEYSDRATTGTKEVKHIIEITEKMVKGVSIYTKIAVGIQTKYKGAAQYNVEHSFKLATDMGGMADLIVRVPGRIIVLDYKNGFGLVDPVNNAQLAMGAVGALNSFPITEPIKDVVTGIVQPNATGKPLKTWVMPFEQVHEWQGKFEEARFASIKAETDIKAKGGLEYLKQGGGSEYFIPGDHCQWCQGMVNCPAKHRQALTVAKHDLNAITPMDLEKDKLQWILRHGDSVIDFINKCKDFVTEQALVHGKIQPGFKIVESNTKRALVNKDVLIRKLKNMKVNKAF